ncbi:MAG: ribonuclease HII [Candidatus Micrarchaeota archaeon]|nr:ribonuclease HII [Candidatus Micrarchaeota archaeon]
MSIQCGGDEAGRGAILGPLVIGMVVVKSTSLHKLSDIGVRDSKMLSEKRRNSLYDDIATIASDMQVEKIFPSEINEAMKNHISLNELEAKHFAALFDRIGKGVNSVYLDSPDVIPERFGTRFKMSCSKPTVVTGVKSQREKGVKYVRIVSEHKADSRYPLVSAASIIAKVTRDREIAKLERSLKIPIGSGYPSDYKTIDAIRRNLRTGILDEHIRHRWITMDRIKQTKLTSF